MTDTKKNEIKIKIKTPIILKSIHSSLRSEFKITITVNKR